MIDKGYIYDGPSFPDVLIVPETYIPDYFEMAIKLESELFYDLRKRHNIRPYRLIDSSREELEKVRQYFEKNKSTFYFLFDGDELIGNVLHVENYISSMAVSEKYQRQGYGEALTKYAVNKILGSGYGFVKLKVMLGNIPAEKLYTKLGFRPV